MTLTIGLMMLGNLDGAVPDARQALKDQRAQRMIVLDTRNIGAPKVVGQPAEVWIGVRLTPIPDALAAHIGADGLMVSNVAENSPADNGGLRQFDVITEMNGAPIKTMDDVVALLRAAKPGDKVELKLVRESKKRTRKLTLTARPDQVEGWKHEEPEMVIDGLGPQDRLRGGLLQLDPRGQMRMTPLGVLDDPRFAPDDLMGPQWRKMLEDMDAIWKNPPVMDRFGIMGQPGLFTLDDNSSLNIMRNNNGQRLEISREPGGPIVVKRHDANSDSEVEYSDLDQLKQEDPDAYEALNGMYGTRTPQILINPPQNRQQLDDLREKFMDEFKEYERQLDDLKSKSQQREKDERSAAPDRRMALAA
ncbi:MAG: PDZ domain-containing protein [Phycisphaerales bacterium]|nr:PDZ domain-containing protein [Phycisphaerales bacterium]